MPASAARLFLAIFFPFAFAFLLSDVYRVVNAVLAPDLVREFGLDAEALGLLTSAYFFAFAATQIPLGILLDRFGPRRTLAAFLLLGGLGAVGFAFAESVAQLIAARSAIGIGMSACLMSAFVAYRLWFPHERLAFMNGCQLAVGATGALVATQPFEMALGVMDWRTLFLLTGGITLATAAAILVLVPERAPPPRENETFGRQMRGVIRVFRSRALWRISPIVVATYATYFSIQGLWAGPWFRDVAGLGRGAVADHLLVLALATVAGFVLVAAAAAWLARKGVAPTTVILGGSIFFMLLQVPLVLQWAPPQLLIWIVVGSLSSVGILAYTELPRRFETALSGRVITALNLLVFVGAFAIQWGMGAIIGVFPTTTDGGYDPQGYAVAFAGALAIQVASLMPYVFLRESKAA